MQKSIPLALACTLLGTLMTTTALAAKVDEQVVGPISDTAKYSVSLHGVHLGTSATKGSRVNAVIDGVAGPRFDEIILPTTVWVDPRPYANVEINSVPRPGPVTFSKDGSRNAYLARLGQEWIVMVDGKELLRIPVQGTAAQAGLGGLAGSTIIEMEFTGESGRHFLFGRSVYEGIELWVDGQKWPGFYGSGGGGTEGTIDPVISPDGQHIAYMAQIDRNKRALIVDGREAGYVGTHLQFTPDSKHLICVSDSPKGQAVLMDGKPIFTARQVLQVYVPPVGNRLIFALTHFSKDGNSSQGAFLLVDGKPAEATLTPSPTIERVIFSPDGKHYAAICGAAPNKFVVIDGKKGQEYFDITASNVSTLMQGIAYSADSSKVAYLASSQNGQRFVVINEEESDALVNPWYVFSPDGKRVAYGGMVGQGGQKYYLSIDGKSQPLEPGWNAGSFTFSPDSSRYAYEVASGGNHNLILDGKSTGLTGKFAFSPASKHFAVWGTRPPPEARNAGVLGQFQTALETGLFLDGQHLWGDYDHPNLRYYAFTNDDEHLFWSTTEPGTGPNAAAQGIYEAVAYLDGKPVARSDRYDSGAVAMTIYPAANVQFAKPPPAWSIGADGALTFLAPAGDSMKRFSITPASDTSVTTMLAEAAEAPRKAAAAAAEAKKNAADKAAAAKAKAEADAAAAAAKAKADYDAAIAKRKADYDAAIAKRKADYDAAVAKRKADYDAAVAAQKAKLQPQGH